MMFGGDMTNELAQVGQFCPNGRCELYGETAGAVWSKQALRGRIPPLEQPSLQIAISAGQGRIACIPNKAKKFYGGCSGKPHLRENLT